MQIADPSPLLGLPLSYRQQIEEGDKVFIAHIAVETTDDPIDKIPLPYQQFAKVFSEEASHKFLPS